MFFIPNYLRKSGYLKKQIVYYKGLGRNDWVLETEKEIEELSRQINNHDEDLDYPNEDVSKGNR